MDGYMQTANRFLNTAQQFAPVVEQFAPMMRNLPAMWKLYKGFQSMPSAGEGLGSATAGGAAEQLLVQREQLQNLSPHTWSTTFRTQNLSAAQTDNFEHAT